MCDSAGCCSRSQQNIELCNDLRAGLRQEAAEARMPLRQLYEELLAAGLAQRNKPAGVSVAPELQTAMKRHAAVSRTALPRFYEQVLRRGLREILDEPETAA